MTIFRRILNAVRFRISIAHTKPSADCVVSKPELAFSKSKADHASETISRLSFDPSLPSYYKVHF